VIRNDFSYYCARARVCMCVCVRVCDCFNRLIYHTLRVVIGCACVFFVKRMRFSVYGSIEFLYFYQMLTNGSIDAFVATRCAMNRYWNGNRTRWIKVFRNRRRR